MDYKWTNEEEVKKIERRFRKIYKEAQEEVQEKLDKYLSSFTDKDRIQYEKVLDGKMDMNAYLAWKNQQIMVGKRWKELRDKLAERYTQANTDALVALQEQLPQIFADSVNFATYGIEKFSGMDTAFTLWDAETVNRLVEQQPNLLPKPRVKIDKDKKWNQKKITSAITQGILQGDSIPHLSKRLRTVTDMNYKASVRNARTAVTSAENGGRNRAYYRAKARGVQLQQQWLATLDMRTRHEHRELDGQIRDIGKPFEIDGVKLDYPADPQAPPRLVYNCRCTTIAVVNGHAVDLDARDKSVIGDYNEWKGTKAQPSEPPKSTKGNGDNLPELPKLKKTLGNDYGSFYDIINNNEYVKGAYKDYSEKVRSYTKGSGGDGWFDPRTHDILWFNRVEKGTEKFGVLAHEFGHATDDLGVVDFVATYKELETISAKHPYLDAMMPKVPSSSDEYLKAMDKDKSIVLELLANEEERLKVISDDLSDGLQDFADGLIDARSKRYVHWGHGSVYYNRRYNAVKKLHIEKELQQAYKELGYDASNQAKVKKMARRYETASELWANQMEALTVGGRMLEYMEKYAPNSLKALKKMLKERKSK